MDRQRHPSPTRRALRLAGLVTASLTALVAGVRGTQDAVANGDTRTLSLVHQHTKEAATITFRRNGQYDPQALEQLNWLLRDWRRDEATRMDPRLFDIVWEVHRSLGSQEPIQVMSAYRSPATNAMLRRRSRAVAKHSQHMEGKAMDFHLPDVPMERVRSIAMRLQRGGVGYYPSAYTPFVHLDAGSVRSWPRMTRDQLARLFPDGRTVHIPADGKPLAGYEEARAEILARGGAVAGYTAYASADEEAPQPRRKSLWATLFGGGGNEDDEDSEYVAATQPRGRAAPVQTASAYAPGSNDIDMMAAFRPLPTAPARQPRVVAVAPRPEPLPEPEAVRPAPMPAPAPVRVAALEPPPVAPPRFTWQTGPAGQPAAPGQIAAAAPALRIADVPAPPRRPDDLANVPGILVAAPLPPARPTSLMVALAGPAPLGLRAAMGAAPAAAPAIAASAPVGHPAPPLRPVATASIARRPEPEPEPVPLSPERAALRTLFTHAATPAPAAAPARVAAARTRAQGDAPLGFVADASPNLAMGFSRAPATDLQPDRFTGPAVKPLPLRR
ncbi:DUF882 domain-containing protein [Salinarimonas soli]|uniref:DUF882 domain-containing protein n=1 Tax=Salinarimonas soli TaxID=1638099 RepID=UPI001F0B3F5C|nr:DUF882 domain-containing protein [Salinarimonas soli]